MRDPVDNHVKAWAKEYEAKPFCFVFKRAKDTQVIAWSEDPSQTKMGLYGVIEKLPFDIEILLNIEVGNETGGKKWQRFGGMTSISKLVNVVQGNEDFVFGHGMHQLCIRDLRTKEYLAFDEHGILFIYSNSRHWVDLLKSFGFDEHYEDPLYNAPHFHHVPPNPEMLEATFVKELNLQLLDCDV